MKISVLLLFFAIFSVSATSHAQEVNVSLQLENVPVSQVFEEIKSQTNYSFWYDLKDVDVNRIVSVNVNNKTVRQVLKKILKDDNVDFRVVDNHIVIVPVAAFLNEGRKITGTVHDSDGEPVIGANIVEKGTTNGTVTDVDGHFELTVSDKSLLVVSYIGYNTEEIPVKGQNLFTIRLTDDSQAIDEVVVVGYGTVKKSNLTGAVASVKMEDVPQIGTVSVANVLQGRVPGLSIRQSSASPEGEYKMVIRGAASTGAGNDPLYVVDGFPGGDINTINPNDIESVEVLKDASATAIYGARAANGVILINTKKGKKGNLNINFKANASLQTMAKPYEMLSSKEYMNRANDFFNEDWLYKNKIAPYGTVDPSTVTSTPKVAFSPEQIANAADLTDWFDEITRTGFVNEESLSITGGSDNVRYLFSLSHFGQDGVVINSGIEKYMARVNLEIDLAKWLTTGFSVSGNQSNLDKIGQATAPTGTGMIRDAMMYPQYLSVYDEEGNYMINPDHATVANPVSWKDVQNRENSFRALVNNFWRVKLTKELDFQLNWGVNSRFNKETTFYPKTHLEGKAVNTKASAKETRKNDYLLDATLTYTKDLFKNHRLKAMAGYAYQKFNTENVYASNSDFLTDVFGPNNLAAGGDLTKSVGSGKSVTKYLSYFGRINYDISDKYLFTFTLRADGSDKFGADNKFGLFPSGAFAWRVIEEDFLKNQDVLSNLKLRLSVGQTGNAEIGGNTYGFYAAGADYIFGNALASGVSENQLANSRLKWETTTEYNVGVDFGLFNNRLTGTVEYYYKTISDLLDKRSVGSYYPVSSVADNLGKTQSQGFELQLSSVNISNKDFDWSTDLNLYNYKDRWRERNPYSILSVYERETAPLHVKYGYLSDGLIQLGEVVPYMADAPAGSIKIKDLNGWLKDENGDYILDAKGRKQLSGKPDNVIDDADKTIIHNEAPDLIFGLGNTFRYKNFDLSFFFYGELGRQVYNETRMDFLRADRFRFGDNVTMDALDRWTSSNPNGKYPSGLYTKYETATDFWVENADFIRLKNLTLGYTLPKSACGKIFKNARFYVDAQNLFVITNYTGSDPETDSFSAYPNQRTFSLGVELSF